MRPPVIPTAFILLAISTGAGAQAPAGPAYPTKTVRVIVPFAPGGGTDLIGRVAAQKLTEAFKQQFIVDNRPGAGSTLGTELGVKAPPDGYTLTTIAGSYGVNPSLYKLSFDPINDITPIIQLSQGPFLVVVHPSLPVKNVRELIALAKSKKGGLTYASSGQGSIVHLATEYMLSMAGVKAVHVPYRGTGPALTDTIAGQTQFLFGSIGATMPQVRNGRLRGIAVTTAKPHSGPARRADRLRVRGEGLRSDQLARAGRSQGPAAAHRRAPERRAQQGHQVQGHGGKARRRRRFARGRPAGAADRADQEGHPALGEGGERVRRQGGVMIFLLVRLAFCRFNRTHRGATA